LNSPTTRVFIALALLTAACSGREGTPAGTDGSISISASPIATTLSQGGTGTISVTIVRSGGFAEPVTISVSGLPDGVTATVTPAQLPMTSAEAQVTLNVSESALPGTYTATVNATANGIASASASYSLVVTARPSFALSASPGAMSVHPGESATSEIKITRTNFTGTVSFALVNPPSGITGQFPSSPALGSSADLTIQVASNVAPGSYPLTVVGSAEGFVDRTATLTITVTQRPDFSLSVSPANVAINAGSSGQVTVNVNRTNFTGAVDLGLQSPPPGINGTYGGTSSEGSTLTIAVASSVAPGSYGLTIRGSAAGIPEKTAFLTITVAPQPDYTLSVTPASLTISSGGTGQVTVNIQRTNFTGVVNLALGAAPNGILPGVNPAQTTGNSATLAITVASTVTPGTYSLTINGATATVGVIERSTTLTLIVTSPPPPPTDPPPTTPPPPPSQGVGSLTATPSSFSVGPGGAVTTAVLLGGSIGPVVQFSVIAAPAGIVGTFSPTIYTSSIHATSTLTISVAGTVAPGTYALEIQGASSTLTRSTIVTVTVPAQSSFTLSIPTPGTAYQGYPYSVAVQIQRTNFTGGVSFQVDGALPTGVTQSWYQNPTATNVGILRLVIPSDLPLGTYSFTVRGSAPGYVDQTVTFQVPVVLLSTFYLKATPDMHGTYKGGTVASSITVDRINFPADVALSLDYIPPGLTATLSTSLLSGAQSSTVTISVASNLQGTGGMSVYVRAHSDTVVASARVSLFIQDAPISYLGLPQSVSIKQGNSATVTVNPARTLYIGPVDLSVTGAPSGITVSFAQNPVVGYTTTTASISVAAGVPVGQYVLTFTGSAPGGVPVTAPLIVNVTP
jgi:uncharacterized membrane protein